MNLGPRAEVPSHQSPVTSATVVLSILPLIPNVSKRASNDRARKHQCSHGTYESASINISCFRVCTHCVPPQILRSTRVRESSRQAGHMTARGHCFSFLRGTTLDWEIVLNAVISVCCWDSSGEKSSILLWSSDGSSLNKVWNLCFVVVAMLMDSYLKTDVYKYDIDRCENPWYIHWISKWQVSSHPMMTPVIADAWGVTLPSARISHCECVANKTTLDFKPPTPFREELKQKTNWPGNCSTASVWNSVSVAVFYQWV